MKQADNIDFHKYAERLGTDKLRLEKVFQLALDVVGMVRAHESLPFDKMAYVLSEHFGILLSLESSPISPPFTMWNSEGNLVIGVESLVPSLESKVTYYHQLGHALLHMENLRDVARLNRDDILQEAEAEIFSIVVAIHDTEVSTVSMLDYLTGWSNKESGADKQAFETILAFFKDNWVALTPPDTVVETHAVPLVLTINDILLERVARDPSLLFGVSPFDFEVLMTRVFGGLGYIVEQTKRTRDGGIDILAVKRVDDVSLRFLIECKRYAEENRVGVSLVRALFGVKHHLGASKAIIATTSDFTKPALEFAEAHRWELELKNREGITRWIKSYLGKKHG